MAQDAVSCELCLQSFAEIWYCRNCSQLLCGGCKLAHERATVSRNHDVILRKDMHKTQGDDARPVDEYCSSHLQDLLILYCSQCKMCICKKCLINDHSKHDVMEIETVFQVGRKRGGELLNQLQEYITSSTAPTLASQQYNQIVEDINKETTKLQRMVNDAKKVLLEEAKTNYKQFLASEEHSEEEQKGFNDMVNDGIVQLTESLRLNKASQIFEAIKESRNVLDTVSTSSDRVFNTTYNKTKYNKKDVYKLLGSLTVTTDSVLDQGVSVSRVIADSPASRAGILVGDRILSVNGVTVSQDQDMIAEALQSAGKDVVLALGRKSRAEGHVRRINITISRDRGPLGFSISTGSELGQSAAGKSTTQTPSISAYMKYAEVDLKSMCLSYKFPTTKLMLFENSVAQLIGRLPFSNTLKEFSIRIMSTGKLCCIAVGIVTKGHKKYRQPGWETNSFGYHADDGGIFTGSGSTTKYVKTCTEGDVMQCCFNIEDRRLCFKRNGAEVYSGIVSAKLMKFSYYPMVGMGSQGEKVILLEKSPWLSA